MGRATGSRRRAGRCRGPAVRTGWPGHRGSGRRGPRRGSVPSPDSMRGDLGHHVGDGLAACQPEPRPPAPQVHRGGHDLRAGQPDRPRDLGPCGEDALHADLGATPAVRPPRHAEQTTRRCRALAGAARPGPITAAAATTSQAPPRARSRPCRAVPARVIRPSLGPAERGRARQRRWLTARMRATNAGSVAALPCPSAVTSRRRRGARASLR